MSIEEHQRPDQAGRIAIVTGANSGIGLETARGLVQRGAHVVLACRSRERGERALEDIDASALPGEATLMMLDLASLAAVREFTARFAEKFDHLDLLVNNAAVMACPKSITDDGFELQLATNHFGHFALTGLLLPMMRDRKDSRIVVLASHMHYAGMIDLDDLHFERRLYNRWLAYGQSKLANLLFAQELHRRLENSSAHTIAVCAHPGWASTNLQRNVRLTRALNPLFAQDGRGGAMPTLHAATAPDVTGGDYFGPGGFLGLTGPPARARSSRRSRDPDLARRLWDASERSTGVCYEFDGPRVHGRGPAA